MTHRVLIAGLGNIGFGFDAALDPHSYVYSHARAFATHSGFELAGGCDPSADARAAFSRQYGVPAWPSLADVGAGIDPDVLVVAVPTAAHPALIEAALDRWPVQTVLCEKPLAADVDAAEGLVRRCAEAGAALYVNFIRRADPGVARVRAMIADGRIASPMKGVVWYSKGLMHNGSHLLDLAGHWLGAWRAARVLRANGGDPDLEVEFERGRILVLAAREEDFSHYTLELISASGRLRYDLNGSLITWQPAVPHPTLEGYRVLAADPEVCPNGMRTYQAHVTAMLADALEGRPHALATGDEALALQRHLSSLLEIP